MNNIGAFKKKWIENPSDEKGVLLYLPVSEVFISAKFGTGENLLKEDITRGFDDYIYVRKLIFDEDEMVELDTAQLDFSSEREDYYLNLNHFCEESNDWEFFRGRILDSADDLIKQMRYNCTR